MEPNRYRAGHLESPISISILALLFILAAGIVMKQSDYDMGRFGIYIENADDGELSVMQLGSFLPVGFETLSETEIYVPDNLYEKINGKAPLYTESGFEKLYTQRFVSRDNDSLWMELFIYDMKDVKNAFSVYSVQKRAGVELLPNMSFAYRTENSVYFVQGRFYIEMIGSAEANELYEAMIEIARKFMSEVAIDKTVQIKELALFPQENLVVGSSKLYLESAFGFEGLNNTFVARYIIDGHAVTAFFSRRSDLQDAQRVTENYYNFLIENGGRAKPVANDNLRRLRTKVVDFYGATELVFATGQFVAGIHEADSQSSAERMAVMLINSLSKAGNND